MKGMALISAVTGGAVFALAIANTLRTQIHRHRITTGTLMDVPPEVVHHGPGQRPDWDDYEPEFTHCTEADLEQLRDQIITLTEVEARLGWSGLPGNDGRWYWLNSDDTACVIRFDQDALAEWWGWID